MSFQYTEARLPMFKEVTAGFFNLLISDRLKISAPTLAFIRPALGGEKVLHAERDTRVYGVADPQKGMVCVSAALPGKRMINTLAHELRHLWQYEHKWKMDQRGEAEEDALRYGGWWERKFPVWHDAELAVGIGRPDERLAKSLKPEVPGIAPLFYLDIASGAVYENNWGSAWRHQGHAPIREGEGLWA